MPQVALVAGAVASVVGTVQSYTQQKKAAKLSRKQQQEATRKSQTQAIRAAQIQRAQATASAQAGGALESSGAYGGIGALSSQLGSELGFSNSMSGWSRQIGAANSRARTGQAIAGLGGFLVNYGINGGATFEGAFGQKPTSPAQAGATVSAYRPPTKRKYGSSIPPYYQPGYTGPA